MISLTSITYKVTIYSSSFFIDKLTYLKIKVNELKNIDKYDYLIEIPYKYKSVFEENFSSFKIIKIKGFRAILSTLNFYKFTVISFLLASCFFFYLSSLIFVIDIKGNSKMIDEKVELFLKEKDIKKYSFKPDINELKEVRNEFFFLHIDVLKDIEFYISGNKLIITYSLKDKEIVLENKHGKMYSTHDAIISKIEISSGNVLVKENNYVKKGDLLVDDYLYYKEDPIYVGTSGKIYGYTFEQTYLKTSKYKDEAEAFSYLINESRNKIYNSFTSNKDRIDKEEILKFFYSKNDKCYYLKVMYTIYRNIVRY